MKLKYDFTFFGNDQSRSLSNPLGLSQSHGFVKGDCAT